MDYAVGVARVKADGEPVIAYGRWDDRDDARRDGRGRRRP